MHSRASLLLLGLIEVLGAESPLELLHPELFPVFLNLLELLLFPKLLQLQLLLLLLKLLDLLLLLKQNLLLLLVEARGLRLWVHPRGWGISLL